MIDTTQIPYSIHTKRLHLRCWEPRDASSLRVVLDRSDAHLRPFLHFMKHEPRTLKETTQQLRLHRADFDRDKVYRYAVFVHKDCQLAGEVLLFDRDGSGLYEVGYWMGMGHTRKGYAREAIRALIAVSFELLHLPRLELVCTTHNTASAAFAESLGFTLEATLRGVLTSPNGETQDAMFWTLFRDDPSTATLPWAEVLCSAHGACGEELRPSLQTKKT